MRVLGLLGSPRKEKGLTYAVVSAALEGASAAGAAVQLEFLVDWQVDACTDCGAPCFIDGVCVLSAPVSQLNELVNGASGLVIGAPVYCWQLNAITHAFMDKYRIPGPATLARRPNGRPALPIVVAGGTGTGVSGAVRSLLDFLCLWGYRSLEPVAATRYNLDRALAEARQKGERLAKAASQPEPFESLADLLAYYDGLAFSCRDRLAELLWLAETASHLSPTNSAEVERLCAEAERLRSEDRRLALEHAVHAFELVRGQL
jgi:multimeric flavodoxin WrbA